MRLEALTARQKIRKSSFSFRPATLSATLLATIFATIFATMFLAGCGAINNPLCGTARPKPVLDSLTPNPASLAEVEQGLPLTITGSNFYSDSIVIWNGEPLPTTVVSGTVLEVTITTNQISSPGTAQILVHTPSNLSGDLGCDSGGDSAAVTFTVS
jgi:IPT/TIG domain